MVAMPNGMHIPLALRERAQWVVWKVEERTDKDGKVVQAKVPYSALTHRRASSTNAKTWTTFEIADLERVRRHYAGDGFVFTASDDFVGVDLDLCRDPLTGRIAAWAFRIVQLLDSYTEVTPSGTGLHVICCGVWSAPWNNRRLAQRNGSEKVEGVEVYQTGRYFTVTGQHLDGTPLEVQKRSDALALLAGMELSIGQESPASHTVTAVVERPSYADDAILSRMFSCSIGDEIRRTWDNTDGANPSVGDWALVDHLLFWTEDNAMQTRRLACQSARVRPKWVTRRGSGNWLDYTIDRRLQRKRLQEGKSAPVADETPTDVPESNEATADAPDATPEGSPRLRPAPFAAESLEGYPAKLIEFVRLVSDATQGALPLDWPVLMFLGAVSILYPRVRLGGLPVCLWVLGVGVQDMGKNLCSDAAVRAVRTARTIDLYTSGSPEGMIEQLAFGPALVYMAEFSGFLKTVSGRSYATGFREQLCDVYDGREVAHRRVKRGKAADGGGSVIVEHPYATFLTTTNAPSIREAATMADLTSGYLSRFAVIAPDPSRPEQFAGVNEQALAELGRDLIAGDGYGPLVAMLGGDAEEHDLADGALDALGMRLGFGRGVVDLDVAAYGDPTPTVGRVVARAKKLSVLFELLEREPGLRSYSGLRDGAVFVRLANVERGIEWAERAHGWALRVGSWLAAGADEGLMQAIERCLRGKPPATVREIMRHTHDAKSRDVEAGLRTMQASGLVTVTALKQGRQGRPTEVWSWIGL